MMRLSISSSREHHVVREVEMMIDGMPKIVHSLASAAA
jgi:hypothetical protein